MNRGLRTDNILHVDFLFWLNHLKEEKKEQSSSDTNIMAKETMSQFWLWLGGVLFGITLILLIYVCPILELTKILYFHLHSNAIILNNPIIEYMYLALSIPLPVGLVWLGILKRRCSVKIIRDKIIEELCFVPLYMVVVSGKST
ncbi:7232_t:CDS:2 [Cetraspora pellucida]|uniref:7232_t:CDS:1 n=1 Tax=Cetraspora pellucida TaxID=1433469 RepID=A0A9N9FK06_9GLOM|nr:7232_t:CDS:2 [Cetraspora pellucida]